MKKTISTIALLEILFIGCAPMHTVWFDDPCIDYINEWEIPNSHPIATPDYDCNAGGDGSSGSD